MNVTHRLASNKTRREFMKAAAGVGLLATGAVATAKTLSPVAGSVGNAADDRGWWSATAERLARPALAASLLTDVGREKTERSRETLGCLLHGLAPWLEVQAPSEKAVCRELAGLARARIREVAFLSGGDRLTLAEGALLAQALLRAPTALWQELGSDARTGLLHQFTLASSVRTTQHDDFLFIAMMEVAERSLGMRRSGASLLYDGLRRQQEEGVGVTEESRLFRGGPQGIVVESMLHECLELVSLSEPTWRTFRDQVRARIRACAEREERLVSPDGSYPLVGRADACRCGIFQGLALAAWKRILPRTVEPGQARVALTAVLRRSLENVEAFDGLGRLQASRHERPGRDRIVSGGRYLCTAAFLPLGLPVADPFWTDPGVELSWHRNWPPPIAAA